jgi:predicted SnoaL-like aldol condensation-catalyzing enzyme
MTTMKKSFPLIAGIAFCILSCNNQQTPAETASTAKGESSATKKNREAFQAVVNAFETGDISMIDSVVASDFVDHSEQHDGNRDSLKAMITTWKADIKDAKTEVIRVVADDEYVFGWLRFTGTSGGKMNMPSGPFNMSAIEVTKFRDGKAVEHWTFMEPHEMMKMMGPQPPAENKPK